jgi:parvulin-like peptidyl-prolyl isomerase
MVNYTKQVTYQRYLTEEGDGGIDVCQAKIYVSLCTQLKRTVLNNLINNELVKEYAAKHHISVTSQEFATQWASVYKNKFHANAAVLHIYAKQLGMTPADFKTMVRDNTLQQQVMYRVTANMPSTAPATHLAQILVGSTAQVQKVESKYKHGESFFTIAKALLSQKNSVCRQQGCGDLGWLPNAFVPSVQKSVITARPGSLEGPFSSQQGLALLLVEGHNARYTMTAAQQSSMRQQLFDRWLARLQQHAEVRRFVAV